MKPFILKRIKIDKENLVVYAETSRGTFKFPILPALSNQKDRYIIRYENNRYVIRTKEYNRLKRGKWTYDDEIEIAHEITHLDKRVIIPLYSTTRYLRIKGLDIIQEKIVSLGLSAGFFKILYRLENLIEESFSGGVLIALGFDKEKVKNIFIEKSLKIFEKFTLALWDCVDSSAKAYITKLIRGNLRKKMDEILVNNGLDVEKFIEDMIISTRENPLNRIVIAYNEYNKFDQIIYYFVSISKGAKIDRNDQKRFVKFQIAHSCDPIMQLRWKLELNRLNGFKGFIDTMFLYLKYFV